MRRSDRRKIAADNLRANHWGICKLITTRDKVYGEIFHSIKTCLQVCKGSFVSRCRRALFLCAVAAAFFLSSIITVLTTTVVSFIFRSFVRFVKLPHEFP